VTLEETDLNPFWEEAQPGFKFSDAPVGTHRFFAEVEEHRYRLEPHIREMARFADWAGKDVLEVGCGIATDGINFARAGARYTGIDQAEAALELARRRFEFEQLPGRFERAVATRLPFDANQFDFVYSHGVLHHLAATEQAVREIYRVLRPNGKVLIMLYHRNSLNYFFTIMVVRRLLATMLLTDRGMELARRLTGESKHVLEGHRSLLRRYGWRYLSDHQLFLSNNTDGPDNPLSKVYSSGQAGAMLGLVGFRDITCEIRFLNLRVFPHGDRIAAMPLARQAERSIGWHLYVFARRE
jgi:2-polyprenyl-3-methyl-5-hydroxy-6-metoxy-1,4-benzoquinol methylase